MVDPYMFDHGEGLPSDRVLFALTPRLYRKAASAADRVEPLRPCPALVRGCRLAWYRGVPVVLVHAWWGAPASAVGLEDLVAAGARRIAVLGMAGSIHPDARIGDVVIPTWGVREEGTSYHYMPPDYTPRASPRLVEALASALRGLGVEPLVGGVWTTDAMYRETRDKVAAYRARGVLVVEMEMTALMTVAHYRGVELAGGLAVSDELWGEEWRPGFNTRRLYRAERMLAAAALQALASA